MHMLYYLVSKDMVWQSKFWIFNRTASKVLEKSGILIKHTFWPFSPKKEKSLT